MGNREKREERWRVRNLENNGGRKNLKFRNICMKFAGRVDEEGKNNRENNKARREWLR